MYMHIIAHLHNVYWLQIRIRRVMFKCENKSVVIMYKENKTELIDNYHHTINIIKAEKFIQGLEHFSRHTYAHKDF